jgi:hypothetical protein
MKEKLELVRGMYLKIKVEQDEYAQDPTKDTDMASFHVFEDKRSFQKFTTNKGFGALDLASAIRGGVLNGNDGTLYMGLERYRHSGDVYALCQAGNFPDRRWDVSPLVGFISPHPDVDSDVIKEYHDLVAEGKDDEARAVLVDRLNSDIKVYNHYLAGEVYGYTVGLYNRDGDQLVESDSCWGFIGESEYCLQEAKDVGYHMALSVLSKNELQCFLDGAYPGELAEYVRSWSNQILNEQERQGKPLEEIAHQLYHYIGSTYLTNADPSILIARTRVNVWDNYPDFPIDDWKFEVGNSDTVLGYWEWVRHKIEEQRNEQRC